MDYKPVSDNVHTEKIEKKIKELNMENENDYLKQEEKINKSQNINEVIKHKNLLFYQELKQKRLSKIKSKIYHKLKKKVEILFYFILKRIEIKTRTIEKWYN